MTDPNNNYNSETTETTMYENELNQEPPRTRSYLPMIIAAFAIIFLTMGLIYLFTSGNDNTDNSNTKSSTENTKDGVDAKIELNINDNKKDSGDSK